VTPDENVSGKAFCPASHPAQHSQGMRQRAVSNSKEVKVAHFRPLTEASGTIIRRPSNRQPLVDYGKPQQPQGIGRLVGRGNQRGNRDIVECGPVKAHASISRCFWRLGQRKTETALARLRFYWLADNRESFHSRRYVAGSDQNTVAVESSERIRNVL
jgi:hypothetical protein